MKGTAIVDNVHAGEAMRTEGMRMDGLRKEMRGGGRCHALRRPLTAAIVTVLSGGAALAAQPNNIVVDGRTSTQLSVQGNHTDIRTGTVHGSDAFNSFSDFKVGAGQQVDMHLPQNTQNLINLVSDSQAVINGSLNSRLHSGQIGGHVFFADPHGLVVGSQGVLNVGALTVATPTPKFMQTLMGADGAVDSAALSQLMQGTEPVSADGTVSIKGQVHAFNGVHIRAHSVDAAGVVWVAGNAAASAGAGVNVADAAQGAGLVEHDGEIQIVASGNINVAGTLHSDSTAARSGSIDVDAGGDVQLANTARMNVDGQGDADGGTIRVWADHDTTVAGGAHLSARGGVTGDGGAIEVSAGQTETLNGGTFDASAPHGTNGTVLFDPTNQVINSAVHTPTGATYAADDSIEVTSTGAINTRRVASGGNAATDDSTGDSGDITLKAPKITIDQGGILNAAANKGYKAGAVTLEASTSDHVVSGLANADSEIQVNGTIKGGDVVLTADASAVSDYSIATDTIKTAAGITNWPQPIQDAIGATVPPLPFGVVVANGTATVQVGDGAVINATGDVTLSATTDTQAKTTALNTTTTPVIAAGIFGDVIANTTATIGDGATVSAGGDLNIKAVNSNELEVSSSVAGDSSKVAVSAVLGMADINTTASIADNADIQHAGNVVVLAHNANSFGVDASVEAADKGAAGLNAALAIIDTSATAFSGADLGSASDPIDSLVVDASSVTEKTDVAAETAVGGDSSGASPIEVVGDGGASLPGFLESKLSSYFTKADSATGDATGGTPAAEKPSALRVGSSMALVDSHQTATAKINDGSTVHASGQVAVHANVTSEDVHTSAASETTSTDKNAANLSISLAIGVGLYHNDAEAEIGNGANVFADQIGVGSAVDMPWHVSGITDFSNVPKALSTIYTDLKKSGAPLTTGYADAEGDTENVGVSGAVNFLSVDNTSKAWVGDGAHLTSTASSDAPWSTTVDVMPDPDDDTKTIQDKFDWTSVLDIAADTTLQTITDAGNFKLLKFNGTGGGAGAKSVGGGVNLLLTSNTTLAGVGANAVLDAPGVAVDADTTDQLISVTPTAGHGSGISGNVIFAMANVNDTTHASINGSADVTAGVVDVNAHEGLGAWSIAGAISQGSAAGVGIAIAVNHLDTDTSAYIGDNSDDVPGDLAPAVTPTATGGTIKTDDLTVQARTTGRSGAISVAAAAATSKDKGDSGTGDSGNSSDKASLVGKKGPVFMDLTQNFLYNPSSETSGFTATNVLSSLPLLAELFSKSEEVEKAPSSGGGKEKSKPKFGLGISGSASVNLAAMDTDAHVSGVTIDKDDADADDVTINALNQTNLISASGAGALTAAKNSSSKFSAGIAGAVAFSVTNNTTRAYLSDSTLDNAGDVAVQALSGGSDITIGLGLAVNASGGNKTSVSGAGSLSASQISNTTSAKVSDSNVTASTSDGGDLDVTAYDDTDIGAGGGSLSVGGKAGVGVAVTYAKISNTTSAALLGGTIDGFDSVSVSGLSASRIADGAASGAVGGSNSNGLEGSFVVNLISNTVSANIGSGDAALTTVENIDGAVNVTAKGTAPNATYDSLLTQDGSSDPADALIDFSGQIVGADTSPGTAILAVAGALGAGKNNVGLSAAYNQIGDTFEAGIANANVTTDGAVSVQALDDTRIVGLAVGLAMSDGQFAGMGSVAANLINDNVSAGIGDANATSNSTSVTGSSVLVNAQSTSAIDTLAGVVALSSSGDAAGLSIAFNEIGNQVDAGVTRSSITTTGNASDDTSGCSAGDAANVAIQACSTGTINALSVGGAVGDGIALAGSLTINDIGLEADTPLATLRDTHTNAGVSDSSIDAWSLGVRAADTAAINTLAGSIAVSAGADSVGAAFALNNMAANTHATLSDTKLTLDDDAAAKATASGAIESAAVGGSVADGFAAAGSLTTNIIGNQTWATASGLSGTSANNGKATMQSLDVSAQDSSEIQSLSGAVAVGISGAAVGGGASTNTIANSTEAEVTDSQLDVSDSTTLDAKSTGSIETLAVAAAVSSDIGLAGAVTVNSITGDVTARLGSSSMDDDGNTTTVSATGQPLIKSSADSVGVGADAGGAAAIAVNHIGTDVQAELDGGTYHVADLKLNATSSNPNNDGSANIQSLAAGVGGGSVGAAASIAVNVDTGTVTADITNGANVTAENNIGVVADNDQGVNVLAGSLGVGIDAVGLGLGLVVNDIQGTTQAYIDGADTKVTALTKNTTGLGVNSGKLADPGALDVGAVHSLSDYTVPDLSETQTSVTGLAVNATSTQHVATLGASASLSFDPFGSASLTLMAGVGVTGGNTSAYIDDASINQSGNADARQAVSVIASHHAYAANFIAGVAAGTSDGAASGAVDVNTFNGTTDAHVKDATLSSKANTTIEADGSQRSVSLVTGLAAALVGGAGTAIVNLFDDTTTAYADRGSFNTGSLSVFANDTAASSLNGGSAAFGAVGAAATFLVNKAESDTSAYIGDDAGDTTLHVVGALGVKANSTIHSTGVTLSGAAGGSAIAGMVGVNVIGDHTNAYLDRAQLNQNTGEAGTSAVTVSATDDIELSPKTATAAVGFGGVAGGASVNVIVLDSQVGASIQDSKINAAGGSVKVMASSDKSIDANTISGALGSTAGISGAVSVILFGQGSLAYQSQQTDSNGNSNSQQSDLSDELNKGGSGSLSGVNGVSNDSLLDADSTGNTLSSSELAQINDAGKVSLLDGNGHLNQGADGTTATIKGTTLTSGVLTVSAIDTIAVANVVGGAAVGGVLGAGGAVAFSGINDTVGANIDAASSLTVEGPLKVSAKVENGTVDDTVLDAISGVDTRAYQGAAGFVGLGAAVAISQVDNTVDASVAGTMSGDDTGTLALDADDTTSANALAGGATGGGLAAGVVVAQGNKSSHVSATVNPNAKVTQFSEITLTASNSGSLAANSTGVAAGLAFAGNGADANATDSAVVTSSIGQGATVSAGSGGITLNATDTPDTSAKAIGVSISGGGAVGASVATAEVDSTVSTTVGSNAKISGSGTAALVLNATVEPGHLGVDKAAYAEADSGAGGILFGADASVASAENTASVTASTGTNVQLPVGLVKIIATNTTRQVATSTGIGVGGFVGIGASIAHANATTNTTAALGASNYAGSQRTGDLIIHALGEDTNHASTTAGSGGVVAGSAAVAGTDDTANVTTTIGANTNLTADHVDLVARHETDYAATANAVGAGVASASGAAATNTANTTSAVDIDGGVQMYSTDQFGVLATNRFTDENPDPTVKGGSGGVISGASATSSTTLTSNSTVNIANKSVLVAAMDKPVADALVANYDGYTYTSGSDPLANRANLLISAGSYLDANDTVSLDSGGAVAGGGVKSTLNATLDNAVNVGDNDTLMANGALGLGTFTLADASQSALIHTYGGGVGGSASATTDVGTGQSIKVGSNDTLLALGRVNLTAGTDAGGFIATSLSGDSLAQAYVRGVIAVAEGHANTNMTSTGLVSLGTGSRVLSASDINFGAYTSTPSASAEGTGHGYELGFIPVTEHDSHTSNGHTGTLTIDGTLLAGIYSNDQVNIDASGNLTHVSGAPLYYVYDPDFSPHGYIDDNAAALTDNTQHTGNTGAPISDGQPEPTNQGCTDSSSCVSEEGTGKTTGTGSDPSSGNNPGAPNPDAVSVVGILKKTTTAGPTSAYTLGAMSASGGNVTLHGSSISGAGSVTASGNPDITVNNASKDYLVLSGTMDIPTGSTGGKVLYTGSAGAGDTGAISISQTGSSSSTLPTISIANTYNNTVANAGEQVTQGPAIFIGGAITNLAGLVEISNASGSVGQFAPISAEQIKETVPNGALAVYLPDGVYHSGNDPIQAYAPYQINIGSPGSALNYIYDYMVATDVNDIVNGNPQTFPMGDVKSKDGNPSGSKWVFLGQCAVDVKNSDCSLTTAGNLSPYGLPYITDAFGVKSINWAKIGFHGGAFPYLNPSLPLSKDVPDASPAAVPPSALQAQTIAVVAKTIDIDSKMTAGRPTNYTITVNSNFSDFLTTLPAEQALGLLPTSGIIDVPDAYWSTNQATVTGAPPQVQYDVTNKRLLVNNVNASGGGFVTLKGGIISTSDQGHIVVNDGYGHVTIDNNSSTPVEIRNVNTGNNSYGEIKITDTYQHFKLDDGTQVDQTHWYIDHEGDALRVYDNSNGSETLYGDDGSTIAAHLVSTNDNDTTLTYQPDPGRRFQWTEQVNLSRPIKKLDDGTTWHYVDADGAAITSPHWIVTSEGSVAGSTSDPDFSESLKGVATYGWILHVYYGDCSDNTCAADFPQTDSPNPYGSGKVGVYEYVYPTQAQLTATESVRADNPFKISFSGNATGKIDITSDNSVLLAGTLNNPSGGTTVDASQNAGSRISAGTHGNIISKDVTLKASADVGSNVEDLPIPVTLTGGVLNATSGIEGIDIAASGPVNVGTIQAGNSTSGWGDVNLSASGDITGAANSGGVRGDNLTLVSTFGGVGSAGNPLILAAHAEKMPNASLVGGAVNISALDGINVTQTDGDLRVGSIASTSGDVTVSVPHGSIYDAAGETSGQALSQAQLDKVKDDLHLVDNAANEDAIKQDTIPAFEHQIDAKYQRYWQLRENGTVSANGTYTVKTDKIDLFKPLVSAVQGSPASDADVQAYLAKEYTSLHNFLVDSKNVDPAAVTQNYLTVRDASFKYKATQTQIDALTKNAFFTDNQLVAAVNEGALGTPSGSVVGTGTPNISGRNISLDAHGNIGRLEQKTSIAYADLLSGSITDAQARALAAATGPGDVTVVKDGAGSITRIDIQQTAPVFVSATGNVSAVSEKGADGSIFLQGNGDLNLKNVSADKNARVVAVGNITDTLTDPTQPVINLGGDLTLQAGSNGSIGTSAMPLGYSIGGELLAAVAGQDIYLRALGHDLVFGQISSDSGDIGLYAPDGSILTTLDSTSSDAVAVSGRNITLDAKDNVGVKGDSNAALHVATSSSGKLGGKAGGYVRLYSPVLGDSLQLGTLTSGGLMNVASNGDLTADTLTATNGAMTVAAAGDADLGTLESGDAMTLSALGGLTLTSATSNLTADTGVAADVSISAGKSIVANGTGSNGANVTTAGAKGIKLRAGTGIGDPLYVYTAGIDATTDTGDINIIDLRSLDHGTFTATTGAVTLDVDGAATLSTVTSGTDQNLTADGDLDYTQLTSGGNLQVTSNQGSIGGGDAGATGTAQLSAANDIAIGTLTSGGDAMLGAGGDISFDTVDSSGGNASLTAGGALDGTTLKADGDATAQSGDAFSLDTGTIGGTADFTSGGSMTLGTLTSDSDQNLQATDDLDFTQLTSGGNLQVTSSQGSIGGGDASATGTATFNALDDIAIDTLTSGGDATLGAGGDISFTTADSSGGNASLTAGGRLDGTTLKADGNATAKSGGAFSLGTGTIGGTADFTSGGAMTLGTVTSGSSQNLQATDDLDFTRLTSGGNLQVTSSQGSIDGGDASATGTATFNALDDIAIDTLTSGGDATLGAGGNISFDTVDSSGGNASLTAGGTLDGTTLKAAGNATAQSGGAFSLDTGTIGGTADFTSGGSMTLGTLTSGSDQNLQATDDLSFTQLTSSGGNIDASSLNGDLLGGSLDAAGHVNLSAGRDIVFDDLLAGEDVNLNAGRDIHGDSATSPNGDLHANAGRNLYLGNLSFPSGSIYLVAAGSVTFDNATVGHSFGVDAGQDIQFGHLLAPDSITMTSRHGSITGTEFTTDQGSFAAFDSIKLGAANVASKLTLAANNDITANITQTRSTPALLLDVTGFNGGRAHNITLQVDAPLAIVLQRLWGDHAHIRTTADQVRIDDGRITNFMQLQTPSADIVMDNDSVALRNVSVQLYEPDRPFMLNQVGKYSYTDAYVVNYQFPYYEGIPNYNRLQDNLAPNYKDESVVRYDYRTLMLGVAQGPYFGNAPDANSNGDIPEWMRGIVNIIKPSIHGAVNTQQVGS